MIKLTNVTKTYPNGTRALHNVNLEIADGEFVFIVGPNGAGKTTLTKLLLHEEVPTSGQIEINGYDVGKIKKTKIFPEKFVKRLDYKTVITIVFKNKIGDIIFAYKEICCVKRNGSFQLLIFNIVTQILTDDHNGNL